MKKNLLYVIFCTSALMAADNSLHNYISMNFDISMQKNSADYKEKYYANIFNNKFIKQLERLYKKNNRANEPLENELRIPLILHQIWVGPNPLPDFYAQLSQTWKQHHPEWTYILWTDQDVKKMQLYNQRLYNKAKSYSEKANILRLEILQRYGGVYVDIDFECLKPLDPLHYCYDFYTGITPNNATAVLANGIIGSVAQHPLITELVERMKEFENQPRQESRNGVLYFSLITNSYFKEPHIEIDIALPATYFYPFKKHYGTKISDLDFIRPESFAIHYWGKTLEQKICLYNQKR